MLYLFFAHHLFHQRYCQDAMVLPQFPLASAPDRYKPRGGRGSSNWLNLHEAGRWRKSDLEKRCFYREESHLKPPLSRKLVCFINKSTKLGFQPPSAWGVTRNGWKKQRKREVGDVNPFKKRYHIVIMSDNFQRRSHASTAGDSLVEPSASRGQHRQLVRAKRRELSGMIHWLTINFIIPATPSNPSIPCVFSTRKTC